MKIKNLLLACVLCSSTSFVQAGMIDFNGLDNGTIVDDEYLLSHGVTISATNIARGSDNLAVTFDTSLSGTLDTDLESPFTNVKHPDLGIANPGNVLIIHENPSSCDDYTCANPDDEGTRPSGYFTISFEQAVTLNSIDFFDIENVENGQTITNSIHLFDINDVEIKPDTFYSPDTGGDNTWDRLNFNVSNVSSIQINLTGSGAIDNVSFTIPEPSTMCLMMLSLFGLLRRHIKK